MIVCEWSSVQPHSIGPVFFERIHRGFSHYVPKTNKKNIRISCQVIHDREMKRLNNQWRGVAKTTDVLSFPYTETIAPKKNTKSIAWYDGEIFLCIDQARRQAKVQGHAVRTELAHLYTHGVLHILGYDHAIKKDAKHMYGLQEKIVNNFFINTK